MTALFAWEDWAMLSMMYPATSGHATRANRYVDGSVSQAPGHLLQPDKWPLFGLPSTNFYGVLGSGSDCPLHDRAGS